MIDVRGVGTDVIIALAVLVPLVVVVIVVVLIVVGFFGKLVISPSLPSSVKTKGARGNDEDREDVRDVEREDEGVVDREIEA